jgi:hypothetical protein
LLFKQRLESQCVSLENVLLNSFKVNGTIKVKNINFHKHVFVRCSFNGWSTYEDIQTQFVSYDFYSSPNNTSSLFYGAGYHSDMQMANHHKDYDTFRFEFQLPKTVTKTNTNASSNSNNAKENITASIQFCICYKTGSGSEVKEYWDSNEGKNYEILQYVIDIEQKKPSTSSHSKHHSNSSSSNKSNKSNFFKFDISNYNSHVNKSNINSLVTNSFLPADEVYY